MEPFRYHVYACQQETPGTSLPCCSGRRSAQVLEALRTMRRVTLVVALAAVAPVARAQVTLPAVNLGDTSFEDGIAFPGVLVEEILGYASANQFRDVHGEKVPGSNSVTAISGVTHVAWISDWRLLGANYGVEVLLPLVDVDLRTSFGPNGRERGLGDITVSPLVLQWGAKTVLGMPLFQRFVLDVGLPTGSYSASRAVNPGANVYTVNPYYAFTLVATSRLEISGRLHYLWCSENDDPFVALGAGSVQPGQAVHANAAASYEVAEGVRIGISGYALRQVTNDRIDGKSIQGSAEQVFGVGPGLRLGARGLWLYLNGYVETGAENRQAGAKFVFRLSKSL